MLKTFQKSFPPCISDDDDEVFYEKKLENDGECVALEGERDHFSPHYPVFGIPASESEPECVALEGERLFLTSLSSV